MYNFNVASEHVPHLLVWVDLAVVLRQVGLILLHESVVLTNLGHLDNMKRHGWHRRHRCHHCHHARNNWRNCRNEMTWLLYVVCPPTEPLPVPILLFFICLFWSEIQYNFVEF